MTLWKQLPLLRILVFFIAGIVLHAATASFDIVLPQAKWVPGMLVLLLTAGRLLHQGLRSPLAGDLSFALFLVLLGYLFALTLSTPLLKEPTETKLAGTLEEIKQNDSGWWQLTLRVDAAVPSSGAALLKGRSEEHTSELQSRPHLVCRLLLEKQNHDPQSRGF